MSYDIIEPELGVFKVKPSTDSNKLEKSIKKRVKKYRDKKKPQ